MPSRVRLAEAGLGAILGVTLGIGSVTFLALALAIDLCRKAQGALRRPAAPAKPGTS